MNGLYKETSNWVKFLDSMRLPFLLILDFGLALFTLINRILNYPYLLNKVSNGFVIDQSGFIKITKRVLVSYLIVFIVFSGTGILYLFNPFGTKTAEAAWFNDNWAYRKALTITIDSQSAARSNVYALLTIDTNLTSTKLQSACQDLRFTDLTGNIIPYYIPNTSSCNTNATNQIWVLLPSVPASTTSVVIYMYYGNPSAGAGSNINNLPLVNGLQGYWKLNESSGNAADNSVNSNTLTNNNTTTYTTGQFANSASFASASSQSLSIADASQTGLDNMSALTLAFWINPTTLADNSKIIGKDSTNGNCSYNMSYHLNGDVSFTSCSGGFYGTGISTTSTATGFISSSTWTHIVVTSQNGVAKIYKNGAEQTSGSFPVTDSSSAIANTSSAFGLGGFTSNGSTSYMNGKLDDVRVYSRALSGQDISALYNNPGEAYLSASSTEQTVSLDSEVAGPSPTLYWEFDQGYGTNAEDSTTNALDGTLNNTPTWQTENFCVAVKCLYFGGSNQNVSLSDNDKVDFSASSNFTLSAWVKRNGAAAANTVILQKSTANLGSTYTGYKLYMDASGDLCFDIQDGTNAVDSACTSAVDFDDDSWHFVEGIKAATTSVTLYVDGKQRAQDASIASTGTLANASTLRVGIDSDGTSNDWLGFVDEVKIYRDQSARTTAQVLADYNARSNPEGVSQQQGNNNQNMPGALSNGLLGYWKTDQTSWNGTANEVLDSSGNSYNGTAQGGATTTMSGKFDYAASLDGTNDYVSVAHNAGLNLSRAATLSAWIYINSVPASDAGIARKDGEYSLRLVNNGTIGGKAYGCTGVQSTTAPSTGAWHHVAWTYDLKVNKVYIDGKLDNTSQETCNIPTTTNSFEIGLMDTYFNGRIDEIRVYNRSLSPAELSQLTNWAPGPVAYWNFEENTGSTVNDASGNGNTATWQGTLGAQWVPGKYGTGGNFNGSNNYLSYADSSSLDLTRFTFSNWMYYNDTSAYQYTMEQGAPNYYLYYDGSQYVYGFNNGSINVDHTHTYALTTGRWYHQAYTYDGANVRLYINGILVDTEAETGTPNTSGTSDGHIGADNPADSCCIFQGLMDDFKIYNYARSTSQIVEDMNGGHPAPGSPVSSPITYWKFEEGYDTTANNSGSGGSAYNGTMTSFSSPATSTSGWSTSGQFGKALTFDGTNDILTSSGMPSDFFTASWTQTLWIKTTQSGNKVLAEKGSNQAYIQTNSGQIRAGTASGVGNVVDTTGSPLVTDGSWHHIAVTYDDTSNLLIIYIDGINRGSLTTTNDSSSSATDYSVGARVGPSDNFSGQIDELKIFNSSLTAEQIKLDMNRAATQVLGAMGNNSTAGALQAANQEYCIPGDSSTCSPPQARWDFEEGTGTTLNDSSGNANTATTSGPTYDVGKLGKGLTFNGSSDYATGPSTLEPATAITVTAWMKVTGGAGTFRHIISKPCCATWGNPFAHWDLRVNSSNQISFGIHNVPSTSFSTANGATTISADGVWKHVAGTFDGTVIKVYLNGKLDGSTNLTSTVGTTGSENIAIGTRHTTAGQRGEYFSGSLDAIRVFDYARTSAQIAYDYNRGAPVGYWKMDECQGTTINDSSGNSNTGTWSGSGGSNTSAGDCNTAGTAWGDGVTGKRNYSMDFDGTDDVINAGSGTMLDNLPANGMSFSAWIKPNGLGENSTAFVIDKNNGNTQNAGWIFHILATNAMLFVVDGSTDLVVQTSNNVWTTSAWNHVALTWAGDITSAASVHIYVNGKEVSYVTQTNGASRVDDAASSLYIGNDSGGTRTFDGLIDSVKVFNYPINNTLIQGLYNDGAVRYGPVTGAP